MILPKVWIIEMWETRCWKPTVGIGLNREDARDKLQEWRGRNPDDKFRLTVYEPRTQ